MTDNGWRRVASALRDLGAVSAGLAFLRVMDVVLPHQATWGDVIAQTSIAVLAVMAAIAIRLWRRHRQTSTSRMHSGETS